jgi:hypothetical protein
VKIADYTAAFGGPMTSDVQSIGVIRAGDGTRCFAAAVVMTRHPRSGIWRETIACVAANI